MDVATGAVSGVDVIEGAKYADASWTPDGNAFYYTWLPVDPKIPTAERPGYAEVRFHRLGTDPKSDTVVKEKTGDPTIFQNAYLTRDGRFLFLVTSHGWTSQDIRFRDLAANPDATAWTPLAVGIKAHFDVDALDGKIFVKTDDGAPKGHVFAVDPARPDRALWKEVVPERRDATLEGYEILGGRLALNYLRSATSFLEIRETDGRLVREVPLPGLGTVGGPVGRDDEDEAYFSFTSFTTPTTIYRTSVKTGATSLYFQVKVAADLSPYTVSQVFYPSKDGTRISMFIVHRKNLKRDGSSRCLLEGYGGFLISETPAFTSGVIPWLEHGGIYAVPNLRGGGEYGEEWHEAGMLLHKQNVATLEAPSRRSLPRPEWPRSPRRSSDTSRPATTWSRHARSTAAPTISSTVCCPRLGAARSFVETACVEDFAKAIQPNTRLIFFETPSNPGAGDSGHRRPGRTRALARYSYHDRQHVRQSDIATADPLGCDRRCPFGDQYLCGHGDAMGGIIAGPKDYLDELNREIIRDFGGIISPFDAWLILRGTCRATSACPRIARTHNRSPSFSIGTRRSSASTTLVWPSVPGTSRKNRMKAFALMSFEVEGGYEGGKRVMDGVKIFARAASLGDTRSLIVHSASTSHAAVPREQRVAMGVTDGLVRISVGIEAADDLIQDLAQALES